MVNLPVIDMIRTGQNIGRLRRQAGLSVRDLQDILVLPRRRLYTSGNRVRLCRL